MGLKYIVMLFGAILALIGVILFAKKGAHGSNVVKMFGFEFQLTGSSLVIFAVGCIIFLVPIIFSEKFLSEPPIGGTNQPSTTTNQPSTTTNQLSTTTDQLNTTTSDLIRVREIVAEHFQVPLYSIDVHTPLSAQSVTANYTDEAEIILTVEEQLGVVIYDGVGGIGEQELNTILSPYGGRAGDLSVQILARIVSDRRNQ